MAKKGGRVLPPQLFYGYELARPNGDGDGPTAKELRESFSEAETVLRANFVHGAPSDAVVILKDNMGYRLEAQYAEKVEQYFAARPNATPPKWYVVQAEPQCYWRKA